MRAQLIDTSQEPVLVGTGVQQFEGLPPEILMVPMPGLPGGLAGIAVESEHG